MQVLVNRFAVRCALLTLLIRMAAGISTAEVPCQYGILDMPRDLAVTSVNDLNCLN